MAMHTPQYRENRDLIPVVDRHNHAIGARSRGDVHRTGEYHRVAVGVVVNPDSYFLVQQRSHAKAVFPGHWDILAEHLRPGETYEAAILRGAEEELGIRGTRAERLRGSHLHQSTTGQGKIHENAFLELYAIPWAGGVQPDPSEVSRTAFFDAAGIAHLHATEPVTPWFREEWRWLKGRTLPLD